MTRLVIVCTIAMLWTGASCVRSQEGETKSQPNIILIVADDMGWGDVGYHGSEIQTPNIDRLSREGVVLDRYYVAPVCSPTRAGLMTGRYPDRYGLRETVIPPWSEFGVDTSEVFLPELLARAGYAHRGLIGKWHLGHGVPDFHPLNRGFTHYYGHLNGNIDYFTHKREGELDWHRNDRPSYDKGYSTDLITEEAVRFIRDCAEDDAPFFLYVAYNAPHTPLQAKKEDLLLYGFDENKPLFNGRSNGYGSKGRGNTVRQTYSAMVTAMDRGIGHVLEALEELGIDSNTVVVFQSDNGGHPKGGGNNDPLRGTKGSEWEGGVRVPAIIRWTGALPSGLVVDQVTGYVDMLPTLCDLAGVDDRGGKPLDGRSMLPVLKGTGKWDDRLFYLGNGAIVSRQWKLLRAGPKGRPTDLLFAIDNDPGETMDVKDQHPAILEKLNSALDDFARIRSDRTAPPYEEGRTGFKAPREWQILNKASD